MRTKISRSSVRKFAIVGAASLLAASALAAPLASAINSYNATPAPEHTETGALIAQWDHDGDPATADVVAFRCSGAMIDEDTFLTAAHCIVAHPSTARYYVSLDDDVRTALEDAHAAHPGDPDAVGASVGVTGVAHYDPAYPGNSADSHDIAVIELSSAELAARWEFSPASLPAAGQLDDIRLRDSDFLVVGYGSSEAQTGPGGLAYSRGGVRMRAPLGFDALNKTWVRLAMREQTGNGGACYGDSGGPNYLDVDGDLVLAGTTITGDVPCYATNVVYRMDAPSARTFLAPFVTLP